MKSSTGLIALALIVLWLAYYVPYRVQQRQQLLESRLGDRFSGRLRVLAVAGRSRRSGAGRRAGLGSVGPTPALASGTTRLLTAGIGEQEEGKRMRETQVRSDGGTRAPRPVAETPIEPPTRTGSQPVLRPSPTRLAVLERRAAAARRRLALSALLMLLTVGAVGAVVGGVVSWPVVLGPALMLAGVLVLGRRASASARRSDAHWHADRRAREAARAARGVTGGPSVPRNARVTGHAVRASHATTQMIPRVAPAAVPVDESHLDGEAAVDDAGAPPVPASEPVRPEPVRPDRRATETARVGAEREPVRVQPVPDAVPVARVPVETVVAAHDPAGSFGVPANAGRQTESSDVGRAWNPVPVPRPTYTMKPAAPRREPEPLDTQVATSATVKASPVSTPSTGSTPATSAPATAAAPTEPTHPATDTLGLDLNEILARRRVAGE